MRTDYLGKLCAAAYLIFQLGALGCDKPESGAPPENPKKDDFKLSIPILHAKTFRLGGEANESLGDYNFYVASDRSLSFDSELEFSDLTPSMIQAGVGWVGSSSCVLESDRAVRLSYEFDLRNTNKMKLLDLVGPRIVVLQTERQSDSICDLVLTAKNKLGSTVRYKWNSIKLSFRDGHDALDLYSPGLSSFDLPIRNDRTDHPEDQSFGEVVFEVGRLKGNTAVLVCDFFSAQTDIGSNTNLSLETLAHSTRTITKLPTDDYAKLEAREFFPSQQCRVFVLEKETGLAIAYSRQLRMQFK